MKLSQKDIIYVGYLASRIQIEGFRPARKVYPKAEKKAPSDWDIMNGWLKGLDLPTVEEGNYEEAKERLAEILSKAHG